MAARRLGILISGRGSNMLAIGEAIGAGRLDATIAVVVSSRPGAPGLERAAAAGIPTAVVAPRDHGSREACDRAIVAVLRAHEVDLVCLAGYMRLITPAFVEAFPDAILNVHPSLLPSFPGLDAQHQAWTHGVKVSGATVHFVTAELDAGPIVLQAAVPVEDADTAETLSARILVEEHRIYPEAIARIVGGGWRIDGRRVVWS
ncbi:MAG TPA: phosphoribosylglycinamide formyltransferase [Vicinamibacterales bacterium]|nr:phosphoribosylglycinamide formyltransferase [Vicinamibacterales bacterium]